MVFSLRQLFVVTLLLALFATACSSSEGETPAAVSAEGTGSTDAGTGSTDAGTGSTEGTGDETDGDTGTDPAATSIPVPEDDSAADDAIAGLDSTTPEEPTADPATTAQEFLRNRFNIDPTPEWTDCIVNESTSDDVLDNTLRLPSVALGQLDDTQLRTLAFAINGCVDPAALGDWATAAIGPQGEVAQTAPACFAESFSAEDNGDLTFYTFSSLTFQFRLDPAGTGGLVDSLTECSPITALVDFFASQAEQASSFAVVVDRDCLAEALSPTEVSREFWTVFVDGGLPPVSQIDPFTVECSEEPEPAAGSDLPDVLPADFVPWSGTGALAAVAPSARANAYSSPPPITISEDSSYEAVLTTGGGEVRIRLFNDTAPITVNNFVNLARDGYYDSTIFHRVLADFMAQGGDPTGTGTGGPGYQFEDEVDGGPALDRKGLLAMANAGPGTNGSQFFITFVPTEWLTGNHTVFGEVIEGIEIIDAIELRDPGAPSGPGQVIESIVIIES